MFHKSKDSRKGFTIIEVLIVLAIAGLIMMMVFLAVPALNRNSRNTQRAGDAAAIAAAINECLSNKNGTVSACTTISDTSISIDTSKIGQLKDIRYQDWGALGGSAATTGTAAGASIWYNYRCDVNANGGTYPYVNSTNQREFMVLYRFETANGGLPVRCVGS